MRRFKMTECILSYDFPGHGFKNRLPELAQMLFEHH